MVHGRGDIWQIMPVKVMVKKKEKWVYPPLAQGIQQASERFRERFGAWPTLVQCNPAQLAASGIVSDRVQPNNYVPPYAVHCWGVPEEEKP